MDKYVKISIDSRKQAIFSTYTVPDDKKKKIDDLFAEIEKLGETCKDVNDFEAKFASSPLNKRYMDIFVELGTPASDESTSKGMAGSLAAGIAGSIADDVTRRVVPTRAAVNQKITDEARKMPVIGDAMEVKQYADFFGRFRKKKDE